jgi:hypothetical protein
VFLYQYDLIFEANNVLNRNMTMEKDVFLSDEFLQGSKSEDLTEPRLSKIYK